MQMTDTEVSCSIAATKNRPKNPLAPVTKATVFSGCSTNTLRRLNALETKVGNMMGGFNSRGNGFEEGLSKLSRSFDQVNFCAGEPTAIVLEGNLAECPMVVRGARTESSAVSPPATTAAWDTVHRAPILTLDRHVTYSENGCSPFTATSRRPEILASLSMLAPSSMVTQSKSVMVVSIVASGATSAPSILNHLLYIGEPMAIPM
mmetsp:Transcript_77702/g.161463  ORF Transcript_77702/g.161463 Transcript_77702/m.161463 type:complete len:205 (+) Transcript_77702:1138-1752(+)